MCAKLVAWSRSRVWSIPSFSTGDQEITSAWILFKAFSYERCVARRSSSPSTILSMSLTSKAFIIRPRIGMTFATLPPLLTYSTVSTTAKSLVLLDISRSRAVMSSNAIPCSAASTATLTCQARPADTLRESTTVTLSPNL